MSGARELTGLGEHRQVAALMFGADDAAVPAVRADQGVATDDSQRYPAAMRLAEVEAQVAAEQTAQAGARVAAQVQAGVEARVEARVETGVEVGAGVGAGVQMQAQVGGGKKMFQLVRRSSVIACPPDRAPRPLPLARPRATISPTRTSRSPRNGCSGARCSHLDSRRPGRRLLS